MISVKVTIKVGWMLCYYVRISSVNLNLPTIHKTFLKPFTLKLSELLVVGLYTSAHAFVYHLG